MSKYTYRTIVWSFGGMFISAIITGQIMDWFNIEWMPNGRWIAFTSNIIGLIVGFLLDQYYFKKEFREKRQ